MDKNIKCISKCFSKKETLIHPMLMLDVILNPGYCLTEPYYDKNNIIKITKKCDHNNNNVDLNEEDFIIPSISFDSYKFLKNIYGIDNFSSGLEWLNENIYLSNITLFRFLNNFWEIYFDEIKIHLEKIKDIYLRIIKKNNKDFNKDLLNNSFVKLMNKYGKKYNDKIKYNDKLIKYIGI